MKAALLLVTVLLAGCSLGAIIPDDVEQENVTVGFTNPAEPKGTVLEARFGVRAAGNTSMPARRITAVFDVPVGTTLPYTLTVSLLVYGNATEPPMPMTRKRAEVKASYDIVFNAHGPQAVALNITSAGIMLDPNVTTFVALRWESSGNVPVELVPVTPTGNMDSEGGAFDPSDPSKPPLALENGAVGFVMTDVGKCGDETMDDGEECDLNSDLDCILCNCSSGTVPNGYGGCFCPSAPAVEAWTFNDPANLTAELSGDRFVLKVVVPQATSYDNTSRHNGEVVVIDAVTGAKVDFFGEFDLESQGCLLDKTLNLSVAELVEHGNPIITEVGSYYEVQFALMVSWEENVRLEKRGSPVRKVEARLNFNLNVQRLVETSANVTVASSRVLWAFVKRSVLVMPPSGSSDSPYLDLELETLTDTASSTVRGIYYDSVSSSDITAITNATLLENLNVEESHQKWGFRVYLQKTALCTLGPQTFNMSYALSMTKNDTESTLFTLSFTLSNLEKLCDTQANISMTGSQSHYSNAAYDAAAARFFPGSFVYVKVTVAPPYGLAVTGVVPTNASVSGPATVPAGSSFVVLGGSPDTNFAGAVVPCPSGAYTEGCYKFKLFAPNVVDSKTLYISSTVEVSLTSSRRRRAALGSVESVGLQSTILVDRRSPDVGVTSLPTAYLIAIVVLAAVTVASVIGAVVVVVRVTRSQRPQGSANSL